MLVVDAFARRRTSTCPTSVGERHGRASLGAALFRTWVLPFEVLSVLLLAALVGAIVLSRDAVPPTPRGDVTEPAGGSARFGGAG